MAFVRLASGWPDTFDGAGCRAAILPVRQMACIFGTDGRGNRAPAVPGSRPRIQISNSPAAQPRWSRDGAQLFYVAQDKKLMAVHFNPETGRAGAPHTLFQTR